LQGYKLWRGSAANDKKTMTKKAKEKMKEKMAMAMVVSLLLGMQK